MLKIFKLLPLFIFFISCYNKTIELKVSPLFSDGMVVQRNTMIDIWGKSAPNTNVTILSEWGKKLATHTLDPLRICYDFSYI